jgi:hypothetical protein
MTAAALQRQSHKTAQLQRSFPPKCRYEGMGSFMHGGERVVRGPPGVTLSVRHTQ